MTTTNSKPARLAAPLLASALALCACTATPADPVEPDAVPRPPGDVSVGTWTRAFLEPANLIADEIVVEGPPALRDHMVVRQDNRSTQYEAETTERGFLQKTVARPEAGFVEIHATLDAWKLVAFRRITWLERPADTPVLVRARGAAVWQAGDGSETRREEVLEFRGAIPR